MYPVPVTGHSWVPQDCSAPSSEAPWPVSAGYGSRAGTLRLSDYLMPDKKLPKGLRAPEGAVSRSEVLGRAETHTGGELGVTPRSTLAPCVAKSTGLTSVCLPPQLNQR